MPSPVGPVILVKCFPIPRGIGLFHAHALQLGFHPSYSPSFGTKRVSIVANSERFSSPAADFSGVLSVVGGDCLLESKCFPKTLLIENSFCFFRRMACLRFSANSFSLALSGRE